MRNHLILALLAAVPASAAVAAPDGAAIFAQNCAACHQAQGQGIPGAFPALAGSTFAAGDPKAVAEVLLNGRNAMPAFKDSLKDDELAAVASYVRSSWGNKAAPIPAETFTAGRK